MTPSPTFIYHITHVNNLPLIIEAGGLHACHNLRSANKKYTNIAYQTLQDRRASVCVPCGRGGTLHDYVPFYFAPRSPMLYVISKKKEPQHSEGQTPIVYLVSTAQAVAEQNLSFVFTDGHGIMWPLTEFYDSLTELDRIDWKIMQTRYWRNDPLVDNDRRRRRQAEFLVHRFFPWQLVASVGVIGSRMKDRVESILRDTGNSTLVNTKSGWYY